MSLIRDVDRDKDVDGPSRVGALECAEGAHRRSRAQLRARRLRLVQRNGPCPRAHGMRKNGHLDVITYNTLIKGYCHAGDARTAKACVDDMAQDGIQPNDETDDETVDELAATSSSISPASPSSGEPCM